MSLRLHLVHEVAGSNPTLDKVFAGEREERARLLCLQKLCLVRIEGGEEEEIAVIIPLKIMLRNYTDSTKVDIDLTITHNDIILLLYESIV